MSVTIRPYRRGGWEIDIRVVTPDGARQLRERNGLRCRPDQPLCVGPKVANERCSND